MQENNKRIAKNTLILYFRMLLTMVIGLYTSRVVLQTLGFSDFGLYNVVGGFVSIFSVLNHTLASGTQRFLSMAIGKNDMSNLKVVFSNALTLHLGIAVIIFVLGEGFGTWFVYTQMNIESERLYAALWVFQFSLLASLIQIIQVPFMSALIAHEKMNIYAYISIFDVTMKLLIVFLIQVSTADKLILYALLILVVHLMSASLYNYFTRRDYMECRFSLGWNKTILKEMTSFSGWIVIGMTGATLQGQGINVLLNIFYGAVVNAARGIAFQVNNVLQQFSNNFLTAVNPQIIKLYANNEMENCFRLVFMSAKLASILLIIIMMPMFVDIDFILQLWLGDYPYYSAAFIRVVFVQSIMAAVIRPVIILTHAVGKMKMPNLIGGGALLLAVPFAYIVYMCGGSLIAVFVASVFPILLEQLSDLYFAHRYTGFPMLKFYVEIQIKQTLLGIVLYIVIAKAYTYLGFEHWINFILMAIASFILTSTSLFYLCLNKQTRKGVMEMVLSKIKKY